MNEAHVREGERARRVAELESEIDELRSANELLRTLACYFASGTEAPTASGTYATEGHHLRDSPELSDLEAMFVHSRASK